MSKPEMHIVSDAPMTDIIELEARIDAFNAAKTGIDDARLLSIMLKLPEHGLYAGLHGHTWGRFCQIKLLWVAESHRGIGLGTALLNAAEAEARRRHCAQIMVSTHSFQAPDFYARRGFQMVVTIADNPIGHSDILMIKQLEVHDARTIRSSVAEPALNLAQKQE